MRSIRWTPWWLACAVFLCPTVARAGNGPATADFNRQIRPILSETCYQCHGPDVNKRKADLRLDQRDGLFQSAGGTTIVAPGKPDESELFARITADDPELRMPPPRADRLCHRNRSTSSSAGSPAGPSGKGTGPTCPPRDHRFRTLPISRAPVTKSIGSSVPRLSGSSSNRLRRPTEGPWLAGSVLT